MKFRSSQSPLLSLLLLVVMGQLLLRHLLTFLPEHLADFLWQATDILRAVGMSAAMGCCIALTPWRLLRTKCLFAALCGYYVSDSILCATWYATGYPSPAIFAAIQGVAFVGMAAYYWRRSYTLPSDPLCDGYLFCVRHIPSNTQDFIISLSGLYGPDGGYSLFANGFIYKFSRGKLVRRKVSCLPAISYHVQRGDRLDPATIERLDSLIGLQWTLNKNCLTVLGRTWREHSGRAY